MCLVAILFMKNAYTDYAIMDWLITLRYNVYTFHRVQWNESDSFIKFYDKKYLKLWNTILKSQHIIKIWVTSSGLWKW